MECPWKEAIVIIGVDPGKATGIAVWEDGALNMELTGEYDPDQLYRFLEAHGQDIEIAYCEWFTISARTIKTAVDYHALHLIGWLQYVAWTHHFPIAYANPGEVKAQFPDKAPKQAGFWHKSDHARDAMRHLFYHLLKSGQLSPQPFLID